jgi:hypothetical protein
VSVVIKYGDVAVDAKENFELSANEAEFSNIEQLKQENIVFPNYTNPCEGYMTSLDGGALAFPSNISNKYVGYISDDISNENGDFEDPVVLEMFANSFFTSNGLTFEFDTYNNIYPAEVKITWYRLDNVISEKTFYPDSAFYFFKNKVEFYNKVVVTFSKINSPNTRLRIRSLEYGTQVQFSGNELINVSFSGKMDVLSLQLPISSCDFVLHSKKNIDYTFQERQPINVYFNGDLITTAFSKRAKRISKDRWSIHSEDYISLLSGVMFYGGLYSNKNAYDLCEEIFNTAKVPYKIDEALKDEVVSGYIPFTDCREALKQVLFATGRVARSKDVVEVFVLSKNVKQKIGLNRMRQGFSTEEEEMVTGVEVSCHAYYPITESVMLYNAQKSGFGENVFVKFTEPCHNLSISNGTILESGVNYAIITIEENGELTGEKYQHETFKKSKMVEGASFYDTPNIISIEKATLVSLANVDNVLDLCYNYYVNRKTINAQIIDGKRRNENGELVNDVANEMGDFIEIETEYKGVLSGTISEQRYSLNGNILSKKTVIK